MEHSPKQSLCVIFPALEMLWNSLCGTRKKKVWKPWSRVRLYGLDSSNAMLTIDENH